MAVELAPVDSLDRGMRGYGLTVIEGTRIDTFGVEILGVEHNSMLPGRDLILVRLSGLGLEETGIVAGMSGSPVFVNERLVGAVAWGWANADEPVGLLTPIHEMLAVMERDLAAPERGSGGLPAPTDPTGFQRLSAPVWLSGVGSSTSGLMADLLSPLGLDPLLAPAGQADGEQTPALQPGSAVGLQLVRGDLSLTAIGTVTHVEGDRIVAFGHDFVGSGAIDLPMTGVHMFGVLDSRSRSFKLGTATGILGAVRQDRFGAVAGLTGAHADILPVEVTVADAGADRTFSFDVARHRFLTPGLTQVALMGALESVSKAAGDGSVELALDVELTDGQRVTWTQVYSGVNAALRAAVDAGRPLRALIDSPFDAVHVASVEAHAEVREELIRVARIVTVRLDRARLPAGQVSTVVVHLQPYRDEELVVEVPVRLPDDALGELAVRVGSARTALSWDDERLAAGPPRSPAELIRRLRRSRRDDELVVQVIGSEPGRSVSGRELPAPPPSVQRLLTESHVAGATRPVTGRLVASTRVPVGFALVGEQSLSLTVTARADR
jgi:hypothetical protein